ncbi:hypothetical protein [Bradyrhizobium sp. BR13661]|uniref:hypothetical protein n=2 Tax=Pseudomonadota TaxID=1224 RepID=UPI0024746D8E|nr:hypothetical protein [Bradyrhizobium sp. BR13661]MDH6258878.1 hypothetical protein [Bradyrhizobium sp. BR13661]
MTEIRVIETDESDPLRFSIKFDNGERHEVDLREFAEGGLLENLPERSRHVWGGDFAGRPQFAREFAEMVEAEQPRLPTLSQWRWGLRVLFRFLDADAAKGGRDVTRLDDVTDAHGLALIDWLGPDHQLAYGRAKSVIDAMCLRHSRPKKFWPARMKDDVVQEQLLGREAARALYNALKSEAREIKAMWREGAALADLGGPLERGTNADDHWAEPRNRAWLVRQATSDVLPTRDDLKELGMYWSLVRHPGPGPRYLAPLMGERAEKGWTAALRWQHPGYHDIIIFLWLFLLTTGWNLSTALSIDVSRPERWFEPHPQNPAFAVIHSWKARSERHQFTLSMTKPEWHPYQLLLYVIEKTKVLRNSVEVDLGRAKSLQSENPTDEGAAEVARLEATVRSPWLFLTARHIGEVIALEHSDASRFGKIAREVARRHNLLDRYPELNNLTTSDARDAWIGYAYIKSGFHVLLTQLAAQHQNLSTLRHYLKSVLYRMHSEGEVRKLQAAVFGEIVEGRIIDPTRLRILIEHGAITEEQERRLNDVRQRTRLGMGCLDPTSPPREIAPDHRPGSLCRVQRCTGCSHGMVFADSLGLLARAYAELIQIRRQIPLAAWLGSSFEDEFSSIEATLEHFDAEEVRRHVEAWTSKFVNGEARIHDTYPSY